MDDPVRDTAHGRTEVGGGGFFGTFLPMIDN